MCGFKIASIVLLCEKDVKIRAIGLSFNRWISAQTKVDARLKREWTPGVDGAPGEMIQFGSQRHAFAHRHEDGAAGNDG